MELPSLKLKKLLIFQEEIFQVRKIRKTHSEKFIIFSQKGLSHISGNGTF